MEQLKGGVWVKASEGKFPTEVGYYFFNAPYNNTIRNKKWAMQINPIAIDKELWKKEKWEWLDELAFDELQKQIAELQAEKELRNEYYENKIDRLNRLCNSKDEEIKVLQAEKEKLMSDYMNVQTDLQNKIFELEKEGIK